MSDYQIKHVDKNIYEQIKKEFEFVAFENLPKPLSCVPLTSYQYEYKTYYVYRYNLTLNLEN